MIKTDAGRLLYKNIFTSHFICKGSKGLCVVLLWEGAGNRTETVIFWHSLLRPSRCVFLVLLMLNRSLGVHSAGGWLSLLHLISIFSGPQLIRASRGPPQPNVAFPTTSRLYLLLQLYCNSNSWLVELNWVIRSFDAHSINEIECLIVIKRK